MRSMKERLRRFMEGRYGADELNRFLTICGWVLLLVGFVLSGIDNKATLAVGSVLVGLRVSDPVEEDRAAGRGELQILRL